MDSELHPSLYAAVEAALGDLACDLGAAECHGLLCGMLCNPRGFDAGLWLEHATGVSGTESGPVADPEHPLWRLLGATRASLELDDMSLLMVLPDDDAHLGARATALGDWCRGFLAGVGLAGLADVGALSTESREFLTDLREIGRVDAQRARGEGDERALFELTEYVKIGALLLREEMRLSAPGAGAVH